MKGFMSRADDQHQPVLAGHRGGRFDLHRIEADAVDGRYWVRWVELVVDRPHDDVFFLGEDHLAGVVAGGGFDPHRPPIRCASSAVDFLWIEVDALVEHRPGGPFE